MWEDALMIEYDCWHHREEYIKSLPSAAERSYARMFRRMIVCTICGNKRCPHANNCTFRCTGSNDLGQEGSAYP